MYFGDYDDVGHPCENGWYHEDDLPDFESARDFLIGIQEAMYKTGDVKSLEHCVEELCTTLDCAWLETNKNPVLTKRK